MVTGFCLISRREAMHSFSWWRMAGFQYEDLKILLSPFLGNPPLTGTSSPDLSSVVSPPNQQDTFRGSADIAPLIPTRKAWSSVVWWGESVNGCILSTYTRSYPGHFHALLHSIHTVIPHGGPCSSLFCRWGDWGWERWGLIQATRSHQWGWDLKLGLCDSKGAALALYQLSQIQDKELVISWSSKNMGLRSELLWFSMKLLDLGWITSSLLGSVFVFVQWAHWSITLI